MASYILPIFNISVASPAIAPTAAAAPPQPVPQFLSINPYLPPSQLQPSPPSVLTSLYNRTKYVSSVIWINTKVYISLAAYLARNAANTTKQAAVNTYAKARTVALRIRPPRPPILPAHNMNLNITQFNPGAPRRLWTLHPRGVPRPSHSHNGSMQIMIGRLELNADWTEIQNAIGMWVVRHIRFLMVMCWLGIIIFACLFVGKYFGII